MMKFVMRRVEARLPSSSVHTISCTVMERPRCTARHSAVTHPLSIERVWVALMSVPTA